MDKKRNSSESPVGDERLREMLDSLLDRLGPVVAEGETPSSEALQSLRREYAVLRDLREQLATASPSVEKHSHGAPDPQQRLRALVVVHDTETAAVFELAAARLDVEHRRCESLAEALQILETYRADVVVADVFGRTHGASDILSELRERNASRPFPIGVAVSAIGAQKLDALRAGYHAFLMKPVSMQTANVAMGTAIRLLMKRSGKRQRVSRKE